MATFFESLGLSSAAVVPAALAGVLASALAAVAPNLPGPPSTNSSGAGSALGSTAAGSGATVAGPASTAAVPVHLAPQAPPLEVEDLSPAIRTMVENGYIQVEKRPDGSLGLTFIDPETGAPSKRATATRRRDGTVAVDFADTGTVSQPGDPGTTAAPPSETTGFGGAWGTATRALR